MNDVEDKTINFSQVKQSLKDLIKIYEPPPSKVISFVTYFIKKYRIDRGFESELIKYARKVIEEMNATQAE